MDFDDMLLYVKKILEENNAIRSKHPYHQFRSRFTHSCRILEWCKRLKDDIAGLNLDVLYAAAIFHDSGYARGKQNHEITSGEIFREYAVAKGYDKEFIDKTQNIISRHSDKTKLKDPNTPPELVILMEADLLDEEGAMGICWDLMAEGQDSPSDYGDALKAIWTHSSHILMQDYMVTPKAKKYWEEKKIFVKNFIEQLESDLFI